MLPGKAIDRGKQCCAVCRAFEPNGSSGSVVGDLQGGGSLDSFLLSIEKLLLYMQGGFAAVRTELQFGLRIRAVESQYREVTGNPLSVAAGARKYLIHSVPEGGRTAECACAMHEASFVYCCNTMYLQRKVMPFEVHVRLLAHPALQLGCIGPAVGAL